MGGAIAPPQIKMDLGKLGSAVNTGGRVNSKHDVLVRAESDTEAAPSVPYVVTRVMIHPA